MRAIAIIAALFALVAVASAQHIRMTPVHMTRINEGFKSLVHVSGNTAWFLTNQNTLRKVMIGANATNATSQLVYTFSSTWTVNHARMVEGQPELLFGSYVRALSATELPTSYPQAWLANGTMRNATHRTFIFRLNLTSGITTIAGWHIHGPTDMDAVAGSFKIGSSGRVYYALNNNYENGDSRLNSLNPTLYGGKIMSVVFQGFSGESTITSNPFQNTVGDANTFASGFRQTAGIEMCGDQMTILDVGMVVNGTQRSELNRLAPGLNYGFPKMVGEECVLPCTASDRVNSEKPTGTITFTGADRVKQLAVLKDTCVVLPEKTASPIKQLDGKDWMVSDQRDVSMSWYFDGLWTMGSVVDMTNMETYVLAGWSNNQSTVLFRTQIVTPVSAASSTTMALVTMIVAIVAMLF